MIGCDIIEIERIDKFYKKFKDKGVKRILSDNELDYFYKLSGRKKIEFLAGRFAAKESIIKSLEKKIVSFKEIEILNQANGKPVVNLLCDLKLNIEVTISHCKDYAMAVSIVKEGS